MYLIFIYFIYMKIFRTFALLFSMLLVCVLFSNINAQQFAFKKYTQASGLASNYIFDLHQDMDGFIWIATDKGVSRFDGSTFQTFTKTDGLSANMVYCIFQAQDGSMWFGTYDGGVVHYDHKNFYIISEKDGLLNNSVRHITQDQYGRMYFMTDYGLSVYQDSIVAGFKNKDHVSGELFFHPAGKVFFNLDSDLYILSPGLELPLQPQKVARNHSGGLGSISWAAPALTQDNKLLFPGRKHCLELQLDETGNIINTHIIDKELFAILEDRSGNRWFAERNGVRIVNGDNIILVSRDQGLNPDYIEALLEDNEGNIWLGTMGGGVYKYKGDHLAYFTTKSGLSTNFINTIYEDSLGRIIIGSTQGLSILNRNGTIENIPNKINPKETISINQDKRGNFYYGTYEELFGPLLKDLCVNDRKKQARIVPAGVSSIFIDANNSVWVSSYGQGITCFRDNKKISLTKADGLQSDMIEEIIPGNNALWFLSRENGAARLKDDSIQVFDRKQGLPSEAVYSLFEEDNGVIWFGTDRGLTRLFENQLKTYSKNEGLIGNYVMGIFKYKNRYLVISDKALHLLENDILTVYAGSALLPNNDVHIKKVFFSEKTEMVWLATNGGVVKVDLKKVVERKKWLENRQPNIIITEVKADTSYLYKYSGMAVSQNPDSIELTSKQNNLHFTFKGISFLGETPLYYQYWLDGADNSWSSLKTENEVTYRSLAPGVYTFYVQVINSAGIWSREPASFSFTVLPPFWMRIWFLIPLVLLFLVLISVLIYYLSTRKYRKHIKQLKQESVLQAERLKTRARIAGELHDDVASTLSSISLFTESLKNRIKKEPEESDKLLGQLSGLTREAQETMEEVVWSLSPRHDTFKELIQRISDYATEICCDNQIECTLNLLDNDQDFTINEEVRKNIYLILKETMHNILKYAQANSVKIDVGIEQDYFILNICDNGTGFNRAELPHKSRGGHGLLNMEKRAEQMNGILVLTSEAGKGTCVRLHKEIAQMRH